MDPLAHTLFGATLGEAGLKRRSRYAMATLLIGSNLPDIDAVTGLWGDDFQLYMRRGYTHGILALFVLPLLLAGCVALWHRWRTRAGGAGRAGGTVAADAPPFRPGVILGLALLATWLHPFFDWLNTYGVRLLMPFDQRWFYGDTLFIVDPWFWLLTAAGVVMARSHGWRAIAGWVLLGAMTSALILTTNLVPLAVKLAWCLGVMLLILLRWRQPAWAQAPRIAQAGLAGFVLYLGTAYGLGRVAESAVAKRFPTAIQVQANPAPGGLLMERVVVVDGNRYRIVAEDGSVHELPRQEPDAVVRRAMAAPSVRGFVNWMRFPYWKVEDAGDHWLVTLQDLRYQGPDMTNPRDIGIRQVQVPKDRQ